MTENNMNNTYQNREEESNIQLSDLWAMIWNHKKWYVISIVICLIAAGFYLYRTPDVYDRRAKLIIDESDQDATMRNLGVVSAGAMRLRSFNSVENEVEAFASPDLMQEVVERMHLETKYVEEQFLRSVEFYHNSPLEMRLAGDNPASGFSFLAESKGEGMVSLSDFRIKKEKIKETVVGRLGDTLVTPLGKFVIYPTENIEKFEHPIRISWASSMARAKSYCGKLKVSLSGKETSVVVLSMQDTYPSRATSILNTLIDVYNEVWVANKNRSAINTTEFINERLVIIKSELSAVEKHLKEYKESNNLTDIKAVAQSYLEESSHYATKAFEVNNQLSVANFIKDYLNDPAHTMSMIPSNLGLSNVSVESQIKEYNEFVLQRDRLSTGSGVNNPLIADLNASLASIRSAILRSIDNMIATLTLQLEKIQSQESQILSRMSSNSGQELQLLSIERQQQITQNLYVFLLQKREENELAALINVGNTRLIMSPNGGSAPVSPNRMMIIFAALVLGFGIPFAYFFLYKTFDTTVKDKSDINNIKVPFLAEIPLYVDNAISGYSKRFKKKQNMFDRKNCKVIVESGKRDMMNEAFRVLRTNVDLMIGRKNDSKVLMLTSFNPNAGKTFTTMNLAASMALKGARVLLIDLDMRKASLSKAMNHMHSGVAAYLNGKVDDYHKNIDQIAENLSILPVGSLPPNPTELLLSDRFKDMMKKMRQEYDYIFLDCPPIDIVADSSIITEVADMTIFVIRAGLMDRRLLPVIDEIYAAGKYSHMAFLLNGVDIAKSQKYGYGRTGFGYGYGYGNQN